MTEKVAESLIGISTLRSERSVFCKSQQDHLQVLDLQVAYKLSDAGKLRIRIV
jgi:hypothetical protein